MATIEMRTGKNGETTFRVKIRMRGADAMSATFDRRVDAKQWAQQTEADLRRGRHLPSNESKRRTFSEAVGRYRDQILPRKAPMTRVNQEIQLAWLNERIGARTLSDIRPPVVVGLRDEMIRNGLSGSTVKRYLAVLSHLFTIAIREWGWAEENPVTRISKPRESAGRTRFLSDDERARLLGVCERSPNPFLYPLVVMAISTGARKNELLTLTWKDLDLDRGLLFLRKTKNGEPRTVPIVEPALGLLRDHSRVRALDSPHVFPGLKRGRVAEIKGPWLTAVKEAELVDFRFHDLRHSCASYLAMNGATPGEIAAVLGHKSFAMVKRYAHIGEQHTRSVLDRMNSRVFGGAVT